MLKLRNGRGSTESRNDPVKRQMILPRVHYDKFLAKHKMLVSSPTHLSSCMQNSIAIVNKAMIYICPPQLYFPF